MTLDAQQDYLPSPFDLPEPDWLAWKKETHAPLWQAVALCCNISPMALAMPGDGTRLLPIEREGTKRFSALLSQACNALAAQRIRAKNYRAEVPENSEIDLAEFEKWAGSIGIGMPLNFPQLDTETPVHISGWPWGQYDTQLLRLLAEATEKFWKNYDPNDPTTAPTNDEVTRWIAKRLPPRLGEKTASVMATILRADDLPSGKRR